MNKIDPALPAVNGSTPGRPTVVLIGASNMTRGLGVLSTLAAATWGAADVLAAVGLGRSYGACSRVLGRSLPGVLECGLWTALERRPPGPLVALLGDVGNDLLYGYDTDTIVRWVDTCLTRLRSLGARLLLTSLPPRVGAISRTRFLLFRSALFPYSTLRYEDLPGAVATLDRGLLERAERYGAAWAELRREWYGIDPIHIRLRQSGEAWAAILSALQPVPPCPPVGMQRSLRTYHLLAERQWLFGREVRGTQPCVRDPDGTTVSLY
jgi:hypothetical protein